MLRSRTVRRSPSRVMPLLLSIVALLAMLPGSTDAIEVPPPGINAFIQTSGPTTPLNVGDFYTNVSGDNDVSGHAFRIVVPCAWDPAFPITFALFDPEVGELDPAGAVSADDEIRADADLQLGNKQYKKDEDLDPAKNPQLLSNLGALNGNAGNTRFTLRSPNGDLVADKTYSPAGATNGIWVELLTFQWNSPSFGCGEYSLNTTTEDNDDNAWILRVVYDPDCTPTPGVCSPLSADPQGPLNNSRFQDDPDGLVGSGDEPVIGMLRTSFQQYPILQDPNNPNQEPTSCQEFFYFVDGTSPEVIFHNFDMDLNVSSPKSVTYYPPATSKYAPSQAGTLSSNELWNNPPNPPRTSAGMPIRGGDRFDVTPSEIGWWTITICVTYPPRNQYIFEGYKQEPIYLVQPPKPIMQLSKTDGVVNVERKQQLDYTITFTNTSNLTSSPGAALDVVLTDTLPLNSTYLNCSINQPYTGTCRNDSGLVIFDLDQPVSSGAHGSVQVSVRVNEDAVDRVYNQVELSFTDVIGNKYPPLLADDTDRLPSGGPPTAIQLQRFTVAVEQGQVVVRWATGAEINTWGFHLYRSATGDRERATRITREVVPGRGRNQGGAAYAWTDPTARLGQVYAYWLNEVELSGAVNEYGPAWLGSSLSEARYRIALPLVGQ